MRNTFAVFVTYLVVIVAGIVVYTAIGFARHGEGDGAKVFAATRGLADALEARDGAGACEYLTAETQDQIERDRRERCAGGILEISDLLRLDGKVARTDIAESSAIVTTERGDAMFLSRTPAGWRISAAACTSKGPEQPYECELES